jgi:hypothetical protein
MSRKWIERLEMSLWGISAIALIGYALSGLLAR